QSVDARADIYSLGCTWYFLLVGKPPFGGTSIAQRLAKHQTAQVPTVASTRSDCPSAINELIQRMMSKRPADRPASAAELLHQLRRISGSNDSRSELANRPLASGNAIPAEDSSSYSSLDDSGPLSDVEPAVISEVEEIDFGSLPPIDVSTMSGGAMAPVVNSPLAIPQAPMATAGKPATAAASRDSNQNVLLGVGLAMSIMALLVVLGITFYQVTKEDHSGIKLKQTETDKGKVIVIPTG
ncbi:MAG: serine/threonine protein kinase, partial [Planctomycetota bacterium]